MKNQILGNSPLWEKSEESFEIDSMLGAISKGFQILDNFNAHFDSHEKILDNFNAHFDSNENQILGNSELCEKSEGEL